MNLLIIFLIIIGGLSKFYKRYIPISVGLELKTFFTIVIAYAVSPSVGLLSAVFMVLISAVVAKRYHYWILIKIGAYAIVCLIMMIFYDSGVVYAGRISVIILNIIYIFFNSIFKDFRILSDLPGNIINIVFNFLLLSFFGEFMIGLL
jgi:hypothetical protein